MLKRPLKNIGLYTENTEKIMLCSCQQHVIWTPSLPYENVPSYIYTKPLF